MNIFVKLFNNINRGDILTNINCSSNCIYQKEGKYTEEIYKIYGMNPEE